MQMCPLDVNISWCSRQSLSHYMTDQHMPFKFSSTCPIRFLCLDGQPSATDGWLYLFQITSIYARHGSGMWFHISQPRVSLCNLYSRTARSRTGTHCFIKKDCWPPLWSGVTSEATSDAGLTLSRDIPRIRTFHTSSDDWAKVDQM